MRSCLLILLAVLSLGAPRAEAQTTNGFDRFQFGMTPDQARAARREITWRSEDRGSLQVLNGSPSIEIANVNFSPRLHFRDNRLIRIVSAVRGLLPSAETCMSLFEITVRDLETNTGALDGPPAPGEYQRPVMSRDTPAGSHLRFYANAEPLMMTGYANRRGAHWFEATAFARARSNSEIECSIEVEVHEQPVPVFAPLTPPSAEQLATARTIAVPDWATTADSRVYELTYPWFAIAQGLSGRADLDCLVIEDGQINCAVGAEEPQGQSFGAAALSVSRYYRIEPVVDGAPTLGARVPLTVRFNTGAAASPADGAPSTPRPSPAREELEALLAQMPSAAEIEAAPPLEGVIFIEQPDAQDYAAHYPDRAMDNGIDGRVTLGCLVREGGYLRCRIESEEPAGMEFGLAALGVTRAFRVPEEIAGAPTTGKRLRRTIVFRIAR